MTSVKLLEAGQEPDPCFSLLRVTAVLGMALSAQPAQNDKSQPQSASLDSSSKKRAGMRHAAGGAPPVNRFRPPTSWGHPAAKVAEMMKKKKDSESDA